MNIDQNWYHGFFEQEWLDEIALHAPDERTQKEVDFVLEQLELEPGARILDLACGHGRHTLELARRGFRMTGVDLSPRSLELARAAAEREHAEIEFIERDMRDIDFESQFDAVINLFTAFGYFEEEEENQRVLDGVARALVPGGRFLIDTLNLLGLARRFQKRMWEEHEGTPMLMEHEFDFLRGRNEATWTFIKQDGTRTELRHSLRTYAPHELATMLTRAGLEITGSWGSFDGDELSFGSWRLILRARKAL